MKHVAKYFALLVTAAALQLLPTEASLAAQQQSPSPCIALHPDLRGFDSRIPNDGRVAASTKQRLTGEVAHIVVHIERREPREAGMFESGPREMFVYPTESGRFLVRFSKQWSSSR
jgi:hypothetical protein